MLLAMADVRAVLVALAARLARLRSAAALAGEQSSGAVCEKLLKTCAVHACCKALSQASAVGNGPRTSVLLQVLLHLQCLRLEATMTSYGCGSRP
jgi:hypothetical protein